MAEIDPELLKKLTGHSDLDLATAIDAARPRGVLPNVQDLTPPTIGSAAPEAPGTLPNVGQVKSLPVLSHKDQLRLPNLSEGVPAGSAADFENQLTKLRSPDSLADHSTTLGKVGHVLSKIGNVAGDIAIPGIMANIPGTDMNRRSEIAAIEPKLANAKAAEEGTAERRAAGERADKTEALAERKEDFEEGKEPKPGTPDEQAIAAKQKETNPTTGKPFTAYEARIALAQDIEDTKPDKAAGEPKTVTMLDKEGGKPYLYQHDPKGNYSGDEGTGQWKKIGPAQPNALSLGLVGSLTPLINPQNGELLGTMNTKTGDIKPVKANALTGGTSENPGATTSAAARLENTKANQFNTQFEKPATDIEQNYRKFQNAYNDYLSNPKTGAASMVALAQHLGSTFGSVKGAQMGENMISEHKDAIGLFDRIGRYADMLSTGQQLSADQWKEFGGLMANTRQIQWETTAKEAVRRNQPVNFLPADVQINLQDSSGKVRHVPGNRVQEYLDKGATLAQ